MHWMETKKFEKWFNALVLGGLSATLLLTSAITLGDTPSGLPLALLLVSVLGSIMGVLSVVLSANGKILTFIFGLLDVLIYGAVCMVNWYKGGPGLGNGLLHLLYFVPMQFVGLYQWRKQGSGAHGAVRARRLDARGWLLCTLAFLALSLASYFVLAHFDKSQAEGFLKLAVVLDVLPLVCNVLGQFLMSTAYMEQWIFWLGVNVTSVLMWGRSYSQTGDSYSLIYMIKYIFYFINAINGLRVWIGLSRPETATVLQSEKK